MHYWPLHCPLTLTCGSFCDHVTPMQGAQKCMNIHLAWPICPSSYSIHALILLRYYISLPPHTPHKHDLCFFKMFRLTCWVSLVQGKALRCRTYWFLTHLPRNRKGMACHKTRHFHLWKKNKKDLTHKNPEKFKWNLKNTQFIREHHLNQTSISWVKHIHSSGFVAWKRRLKVVGKEYWSAQVLSSSLEQKCHTSSSS